MIYHFPKLMSPTLAVPRIKAAEPAIGTFMDTTGIALGISWH